MNGELKQRLASTPATNQKLKKDEFELTNGTANQRSLIAEYKVPSPTFLRRDAPLRLVFSVVEEFQTDGDADADTYNLSNNIIETPNSANLVLFEAGSRVQPDSVDYANNTFTYTGPGAAEYLHAFYVARDPVQIEIERQAPKSQGSVSDIVFDDPTSLLHERDQNQDPPRFQGRNALDFAIPRNWKVQVYAEGPVGFDWDDSDTANSQSTTATNAILSLPVRRANSDVPGLSQAVKRHIIER